MPDTTIFVRPACASDLGPVAALFYELDVLHARLQPGFFRVAPDRPGPPEAAPELRRALSEPDVALLVATLGGALAGALSARLYDTPRALALVPRRRAHVEALVVAAAFRKRGVGRRLMQAAETWARARGAEQLLLTVWADNDDAARFYRTLGYAPASQVLSREL